MKKAYNRVFTPDGQLLYNAVVVFNDAGSVLSWHVLEGEESFVEWVGGTYRIPQSIWQT